MSDDWIAKYILCVVFGTYKDGLADKCKKAAVGGSGKPDPKLTDLEMKISFYKVVDNVEILWYVANYDTLSPVILLNVETFLLWCLCS